MTAGSWNIPRKSTILTSCSLDKLASVSRCEANLSAYQAVRSAEFLTDSGFGIGVKSNPPASTALRNRISVATIVVLVERDRFDHVLCEAMFVLKVWKKKILKQKRGLIGLHGSSIPKIMPS